MVDITKKNCFVVQSFSFDTKGMKKNMNTAKMINFAKETVKFNHSIGLDKELKVSDVKDKTNAWVYLRNIGLGVGFCKRM